MRPATPNAPPNTPRRLVNRFILASHQTCRSFLRASLSERVHYPILTILTESGWARLDCARHHPLQSEQQRVPGTPSTSFVHGGGQLGWPSLRASTEHSIRQGPERINPECAVREHNGQPCRPAPFSCVRDARARGISLAAATISREAPARNSYFGIRVASLTGGSILI